MLESETIPRVERGTVPAIAVTGVSKSFALPHLRTSTVRDRMLHPFGGDDIEEERLEALHDVSFEVERGEFFGIAGKNGSGKSTLLRCVAGIYPVDRGTIEVPGRLVPFIELGVGFNPELSARDNVVANAVMFGLNRKEAAARVDEILAFAELERFGYQKLKNYSTGMSVRLAFAVTMYVEADTLVFDEVLAVGDSAFKEKCFAHFAELRGKGQTIVLVTHDMQAIRQRCDRALLLHGGEVVDIGAPQAIAEQYDELNSGGEAMPRRIRAAEPAPAPSVATRPQRARLLGAEPRTFIPLVRMLAKTEFQLKYMDSRLSYAWAVARPLGLFGVMYAVFSALGRFNNGVHNYPVYLFMSIVLWTFFAQATDGSVWSLVRRASFLRKIPFPLLAAPLSQVASALIDLLGNLVVVLLFAVLLGVEPRFAWLELIPLVAALALLATGLACLLSAAFVRHRDLHQIWAVILQALFFTTPLFYVSSALQAPWDRVMVLANPIAAIITQAHQALVDPSAPGAAEQAGGAVWLLCPAAVVLALCVAGLWVFARESAHAAENV